MYKALWNIKAKYKYKGKGIPERQNGMYKGTEARNGVEAIASSLVMPECKGNKAGEGVRELETIQLLQMWGLLDV